ncbi:hypothetical protein SGPA1_21424 [Streptomyces misionensis JCM 4497]
MLDCATTQSMRGGMSPPRTPPRTPGRTVDGPARPFRGVGDERPVGRAGRPGHAPPGPAGAGAARGRARRGAAPGRPGRGPRGGPLTRRQARPQGPSGEPRPTRAEDPRHIPVGADRGHGGRGLVVLRPPERQHPQPVPRRQGRHREGRRLRPHPDQHPGDGLRRAHQRGGLQARRRLREDRGAERQQRGRGDGAPHIRRPLQRHRDEHPARHHDPGAGLQEQRERPVDARLLRPDQQRAPVRPRLPGGHRPPAHRHHHRPLRQAGLLRRGQDVRRGRRCPGVRQRRRLRHLLASEAVQGHPHPQGRRGAGVRALPARLRRRQRPRPDDLAAHLPQRDDPQVQERGHADRPHGGLRPRGRRDQGAHRGRRPGQREEADRPRLGREQGAHQADHLHHHADRRRPEQRQPRGGRRRRQGALRHHRQRPVPDHRVRRQVRGGRGHQEAVRAERAGRANRGDGGERHPGDRPRLADRHRPDRPGLQLRNDDGQRAERRLDHHAHLRQRAEGRGPDGRQGARSARRPSETGQRHRTDPGHRRRLEQRYQLPGRRLRPRRHQVRGVRRPCLHRRPGQDLRQGQPVQDGRAERCLHDPQPGVRTGPEQARLRLLSVREPGAVRRAAGRPPRRGAGRPG